MMLRCFRWLLGCCYTVPRGFGSCQVVAIVLLYGCWEIRLVVSRIFICGC